MTTYRAPETWNETVIGDVCNLRSGGTPSRKNPTYWNGDIPWIKTGELDYCRITTTEERITPLGLKESSATLFPEGTLLMAMYGQGVTRGKVAITGLEAATNQACAAITPTNQDKLTVEFLYWFLYYRYEELRSRGHGANQRNLSMTLIKIFEIAYPPLPEQKKIAHILSTVQRAIEAQERIIQTTTELKKALMHKLFTEGLRNEPQKQTDIGPIPESWKLVRCEEVCDTISVGIVVKPSSYYVLEGVPAFRSQNVRADRIQPEPMVHISEEANNGPVKKSKLSTGDVLIVRTGYPGTSCVVPSEFDGSNCIDLIFVRPNKSKLRSHYLSRFFNSDAAKVQVQAGKIGLAQQHFNVGAVKNTRMPLPPEDEQDEIITHLELIDSKHDLATAKRNSLQDLFRTLLHELMTEKTRVHEVKL